MVYVARPKYVQESRVYGAECQVPCAACGVELGTRKIARFEGDELHGESVVHVKCLEAEVSRRVTGLRAHLEGQEQVKRDEDAARRRETAVLRSQIPDMSPEEQKASLSEEERAMAWRVRRLCGEEYADIGRLAKDLVDDPWHAIEWRLDGAVRAAGKRQAHMVWTDGYIQGLSKDEIAAEMISFAKRHAGERRTGPEAVMYREAVAAALEMLSDW
jgi:hypothetical protein